MFEPKKDSNEEEEEELLVHGGLAVDDSDCYVFVIFPTTQSTTCRIH